MNNNKTLDVADWCYTPPPIVAKVPAPHRYWSSTPIGVIGTLLIHALIVPSVYMGSRGPKVRPPERQESTSLAKSKADSTDNLVLITLPTNADSSDAASRDMSLQFSPIKMAAVSRVEVETPALLDAELLPLSEEQPAQVTGNGEDGTEQARLRGIYSGQIRARIERIWRRPRTPISEGSSDGTPDVSDESFQCQVQIVQDANGFVQEVLLPRCRGSAAWRRSLVMAIQQASPLPAAPSPRVFTRSIVLDFVAVPYVTGSPEDEYEFEEKSAPAVAAVGQRAAIAFDEFRAKTLPDGLGDTHSVRSPK
jgi:TonB C terminal